MIGNISLKSIFSNPKNVNFIKMLIKMVPGKDFTILDFFSGSSTTAHAVMKLNSGDDGKRKFIMIQLNESCDIDSEAYKNGYKPTCDIGRIG